MGRDPQLTSIGRVDIKVPVRSNGKYLGSLHISRGSIDWVVGRATTYGHHSLSWEKFDELMRAEAPEQPLKTPGRRAPRKRPI